MRAISPTLEKISIPAPARGRTPALLSLSWPCSYFNSRPREGANQGLPFLPPAGKFQFPPPRGGEPEKIRNRHHRPISIPAPARGRTALAQVSYCSVRISIPAPARGRTLARNANNYFGIFQFPPPRGGEQKCQGSKTTATPFQFPPPRGGERGR